MSDRPAHPFLEPRLRALLEVLKSMFVGGDVLSSASKGAERELFVRAFLAQVFSPMHRFDSGDITDSYGLRSGQIDIVVSTPETALGFPMFPEGPRLYLAEGVAAAIEVKSDLAKQWPDVVATAAAVKKLRRCFQRQNLEPFLEMIERQLGAPGASPRLPAIHAAMLQHHDSLKDDVDERIPTIAVGFRGWKTRDALLDHLRDSPVDAALIIESELFESTPPPNQSASGVWALLALTEFINEELARKVMRDSPSYTYLIASAFRRRSQ